MSYQVLARKWRPSNFSQVAGQSHVLKSLINALDNERLHHAYLFTGTRGVGKTTLARILAKCLNCEEGISSTPCESCNACVEINEGRFVDLIEVDAASRTKVDDTRELLDNVQYSPSRGRFKVYLIDEVHMLSNHSFNALLKTLEEPPPHVKFLLATTDPQKLPVTILSRCLQFNLKNLNPGLIQNYLVKVLEEEKITYDDAALWQIAAAAAGSMRDALTLVDQAIAYCQGEITADGVIEMLGVPQHQQVHRLLEAMASRDAAAVLEIVAHMAEQTPDYGNALDSLLSALHRIALAQMFPDSIDNSFGDKATMQELAEQFSAEDIQLYYQIGNKGRDDLRLATDMRAAFEMLLLRMLVFSPRYQDHAGQEAEPADEKKKSQARDKLSPDQTGTGNEQIAAENESGSESEIETAQQEAGSEPEPQPVAEEQQENSSTEPEPGNEKEVPVEASEEPISVAPLRATLAEMNHERWLEIYPDLNVSGIVANVLANCVWQGSQGDKVQLQLDQGQSAVFNEDLLPRISLALTEYFAQPLTVEIAIATTSEETPAGKGQRLREESHQAMIEAFEQDGNVQQLLSRFSGTLARDSITPLDD